MHALLNRVADGISRPYYPDVWHVSFSRWTRLPGYATACCVPPRESRHRSYSERVSTPSHPRELVWSRALLIGRINFVIKSSRIITEHDRGRLDRPAIPCHDEIIKDQLPRALSADRLHRGFARAPTTALYLCWQWFMVKLAYMDCLFIGEISYGPICHEEALARLGGIARERMLCRTQVKTSSAADEIAEGSGRKIWENPFSQEALNKNGSYGERSHGTTWVH